MSSQPRLEVWQSGFHPPCDRKCLATEGQETDKHNFIDIHGLFLVIIIISMIIMIMNINIFFLVIVISMTIMIMNINILFLVIILSMI